MKEKVRIMDATAISRALARMTHEIIERSQGLDRLCLLGIKRRGVPLARRLQENLERFGGVSVPLGYLDITRHRDDLTDEEKRTAVAECHIPVSLSDRTVILVDDVLYTGRTARAAMEAVFSLDRPQAVRLAVLIDRGHRELPLRPDYVGKNVPTSKSERVTVMLEESDGEGAVYISEKPL